ncbi:MAG: DeoR/GlpR family DNA-binding transcription regulator [Treponema sp.]|nr:DeoR/GlpR family DNA-binding transcription regulator [Treponema sp.]
MINRHTKILEVLSKQQRVDVTALSVMLGVSQVTVRKDLDRLEERGLILREHGYACLDGMDDMGKRMAHYYDIKKSIAKAAAETVVDGETIMVESGSCCAFFAEEVANTKRDITIITNSVFITNYIRHIAGVKVILLGGYYQPDSQVMVGPMTKKCGEIFYSNKFFIGVDGFMPKFGFTGKDHLRVQTILDLSEFAHNIVVLTESEKFRQQGVLGLAKTESVSEVFTDDGIPLESEKILHAHNVTIHKVNL